MNNIDDKIRAALRRADPSDGLMEEPNVAEEVLTAFRGRNRWIHGLAALFSFGFFAFGVWTATRFLDAETTRDQLLWAVVTLWAFLAVGLLKIWFWMEMHTNRLMREVKRVELLLLVKGT